MEDINRISKIALNRPGIKYSRVYRTQLSEEEAMKRKNSSIIRTNPDISPPTEHFGIIGEDVLEGCDADVSGTPNNSEFSEPSGDSDVASDTSSLCLSVENVENMLQSSLSGGYLETSFDFTPDLPGQIDNDILLIDNVPLVPHSTRGRSKSEEMYLDKPEIEMLRTSYMNNSNSEDNLLENSMDTLNPPDFDKEEIMIQRLRSNSELLMEILDDLAKKGYTEVHIANNKDNDDASSDVYDLSSTRDVASTKFSSVDKDLDLQENNPKNECIWVLKENHDRKPDFNISLVDEPPLQPKIMTETLQTSPSLSEIEDDSSKPPVMSSKAAKVLGCNLAETPKTLRRSKKQGIIFAPQNKDVTYSVLRSKSNLKDRFMSKSDNEIQDVQKEKPNITGKAAKILGIVEDSNSRKQNAMPKRSSTDGSKQRPLSHPPRISGTKEISTPGPVRVSIIEHHTPDTRGATSTRRRAPKLGTRRSDGSNIQGCSLSWPGFVEPNRNPSRASLNERQKQKQTISSQQFIKTFLPRRPSLMPKTTSKRTDGLTKQSDDDASRPASSEVLEDYVPPTQEEIEKALRQRKYVIDELVKTEKDYIEQLEKVMRYMDVIKEHEGMPEDLRNNGKYRMVFGNIQSIYEWHRDHFCNELSEACSEPKKLGLLFQKNKRKFDKYYRYCENKPMSEFIVKEHEDYFLEICGTFKMQWEISHLLIVPIQRMTKYPLLLKEIIKFTKKADLQDELPELKNAQKVVQEVTECANNIMKAGRIQGYTQSITSQGRLLKNGELKCMEGSSVQNFKGKPHQVFLFEQTVMFATSSKKSQSPEVFTYKGHLKVNQMELLDDEEGGDRRKFILLSMNADEIGRAYVCQAADEAQRDQWTEKIQELLNLQKLYSDMFTNPTKHRSP